jgi:putative transcriptional regulator
VMENFNTEVIRLEFKCRLKVILAEREISHGDFAKNIGISGAALSAIVNNRTLPSFETAYKIEDILGLNLKEIWKKK